MIFIGEKAGPTIVTSLNDMDWYTYRSNSWESGHYLLNFQLDLNIISLERVYFKICFDTKFNFNLFTGLTPEESQNQLFL